MNIFSHKLPITFIICITVIGVQAQDSRIPLPLERFLRKPTLQGATVSLLAKEVQSGDTLYIYNADRKLAPASVAKLITTATALELLGKDFRFETSVQYDGILNDSILNGNLYLCGNGDPTLGSPQLETPKDSVFALWTAAIKKAGIRKINGRIIADDSVFDTEGVSMKWMREDLGSNYGQGSYGLNIFDNVFNLYLNATLADTTPTILYCDPPVASLQFHNYLVSLPVSADSCYITGFPYTNERYLYGVIRAGQHQVKIEGDIPDPPLFAAQYFCAYLQKQGIEVSGEPSCRRLLSQAGEWRLSERNTLKTTYSPPLEEIVRITNTVSHNLYADALVKTLGRRYQPQADEVISSFDRGTKTVITHWENAGLNTSGLSLYDGSGLAFVNTSTATFMCDLLIYMAKNAPDSAAFFHSLPRAGADGTISTFLKNTVLEGSRLKSGSMSGVQCYSGYILKNSKQYAVTLLINNFSSKNRLMRTSIEELFLSLF